jgi:hypothetical protein
MKYAVAGLKLAIYIAMLSGASAFTQTANDEATVETSAPVAYVYVQVAKGVNVYSETAAGKLTLIKGSPFTVSGQMEGITGSHLLSVGTKILHSYPIASNGAIGKQIASIDTATYDSQDCGPTTGNQAVLDHSGKHFYVQLSGGPGGTACTMNDWQTYQIDSNGDFTFIGNAYPPYYNWSPNTAPFFDSSDKYAYSFTQLTQDDEYGFFPFTRISNGYISLNTSFTEKDPKLDPNLNYFLSPYMATADPHEHMAVVMVQCEYNDSDLACEPTGDNPQLASYTIDPVTGGISSTNTEDNVPYLEITYPIGMDMSYDGKFVAIGGYSGFQVFNFNGAALPTQLSPLMRSGVQFDQVTWDKADHLFALSYEAQELYIFNVSKARGVVEIGEPMIIPGAYGLTGIIVVPK